MVFLDLFNMIARKARPAHHEFVPLDSMSILFTDTDLDSLDMLMVAMFFSEIYGIDDEIAKYMTPASVQEMYDQIQEHKTKDPESLELAMEAVAGW